MDTTTHTAYLPDGDLDDNTIVVQSITTNADGDVVTSDDLVNDLALPEGTEHGDRTEAREAATAALTRAGWEVVGQWDHDTATVVPA